MLIEAGFIPEVIEIAPVELMSAQNFQEEDQYFGFSNRSTWLMAVKPTSNANDYARLITHLEKAPRITAGTARLIAARIWPRPVFNRYPFQPKEAPICWDFISWSEIAVYWREILAEHISFS